MRSNIFLFGILTLMLFSCSNGQTPETRPKPEANLTDKFIPTDSPTDSATASYPWEPQYEIQNALVNRIPPPDGFVRTTEDQSSFAWWLRHIPLKPGKPQVMLYNGSPKGNQDAHVAVIDIDAGTRDLQQCADAVMRLRAEYLLSAGKDDEISFNFTSGDACPWSKWKAGYRPKVSGNNVSWVKSQTESGSHKNFRAYMDQVFNYAGTASLEKELKPKSVESIRAGDVFIQGGHPGHAIIVMDVAQNSEGKKVFLLAQSYMPAQDIQILKNPANPDSNPWYSTDFGQDLYTPEWTFLRNNLRSF